MDKIGKSIGIYGADGLTIDEIVSESCIVTNGRRVPVVRHVDVRESVKRLEASERVMVLKSSGNRYALTESSRTEFDLLRQDTATRANRVVHKLFADQVSDPRQMVEPFYQLLGRVFSRLGSSYVSALRGDGSNLMPVPREEMVSAISAISAYYKLNEQILLDGATRFFSATDPDSVTTKWNIAQNFYIALALGMDPSGTLLSDELVGNCRLYLDTNVVMEGLEKGARFHDSFRALVAACQTMGMVPMVWRGTLGELDRVVNHYIDTIKRVAEKIPKESQQKVRGLLYEKYREATASGGDEVDIRALYANFSDARRILTVDYRIEIEDDSVEDEEKREQVLDREIASMIDLYERRRYGRRKSRVAALHDATLIDKAARITSIGDRCYVVTLDRVLSEVRLSQYPHVSVAIGLDACLQWISPFAGTGQESGDFAEIFSSALASHIFPNEIFFDINDFAVFADIDWDTSKLPAQDVEDCVRHLKKVAHQFDPSKATGRERLHGEIARFFSDPGRKYNQRLQELEGTVKEVTSQAAQTEQSLRGQLADRAGLLEELEGQLKAEITHRVEVSRSLKDLTERVDEILAQGQKREKSLQSEVDVLSRDRTALTSQLEQEREERRLELLKGSTRVRLVFLLYFGLLPWGRLVHSKFSGVLEQTYISVWFTRGSSLSVRLRSRRYWHTRFLVRDEFHY